MSYPSIEDEDFYEDLHRRKEFYQFKVDPGYNFRDPAVHDVLSGKYLKIHSHQLFNRNFMSPNTNYTRELICHQTGTGKTLLAIATAHEFIKVYKKVYRSLVAKVQPTKRNIAELDKTTPTVFVLGFGGTKAAFLRELLKYPEFGFVTLAEREELVKRQRLAEAGLPDDIRQLKEYYSSLKKRITNKSRDGFYKFYGYQEFVNRLFISGDIKLTDLESLAAAKARAGEAITLESIVYDYISSGKIQVNYQLLDQFKNSLIICDEIHRTYNMNMKNNYGVAIQFVLDATPSCRALFMSATPIGGSPTEIVEVLNYLVPADKKVTKTDLFSDDRTLRPGALERIGRLSRGRVSFMQDVNLKYFPERIFMGEDVEFPGNGAIPYLKFIKCPMSKLHQQTLNSLARGDIETDEEKPAGSNLTPYSYHRIPTDGHAIYDMVFPNPQSSEVGLFRSSEIKNKLSTAPQEWRDEHKIQIKKTAGTTMLAGDFLLRENIAVYSTKSATILDILDDITKSAQGVESECEKTMIYHDRVKTSGVLHIQELLKANNYLDEFAEPVETTRCAVCGEPFGKHEANNGHKFYPARFIMAHSDIDKDIMDRSFAKFNSASNAHGHNYQLLVGSKIIKESYDFKDIQNMIIVSHPVNIPTLIQILGRAVRKSSHANLPPEKRRVKIYILLSTVNETADVLEPISPEMYKYMDKLQDYIVIQKIEREINKHAIDASTHRDIIMPPELRAKYFPAGATEPVAALGNLYFDPIYEIPHYEAKDLNMATFTAYKHHEEEIRMITYVIKRLFIREPVWTYDNLLAAVRRPHIGLEVNPELFAESNFIIALHHLVSDAPELITTDVPQSMTESHLIEKLFDYSERYIYVNDMKYKIEHLGKYYVLFPVVGALRTPLAITLPDHISNAYADKNIIKTMLSRGEKPMIDVETYTRVINKGAGLKININDFAKAAKIGFEPTKRIFKKQFCGAPDVTSMLDEYSDEFQREMVEEAILYMLFKAGIKSIKCIPDEAMRVLYSKIIDLYDRFRVVVYLSEVKKYKDTVKQFARWLPGIADTPIGYMTAKSIKLYDPERGWIEVSKLAMNKLTTFKENEVIIGYFEPNDTNMKFKLRKPIQYQKVADAAKQDDTRFIERGIVCSTKGKDELLVLASKLGIHISKLAKGDIRIKRLCELIKNRLIGSEIKERQKDSKYKYVYSWWDEMPSLSS